MKIFRVMSLMLIALLLSVSGLTAKANDDYSTPPDDVSFYPGTTQSSSDVDNSPDATNWPNRAHIKNISSTGIYVCKSRVSDTQCASNSPRIILYKDEVSKTKPSPDWDDTDGFYCGAGYYCHIYGNRYTGSGSGLPPNGNARFIAVGGCFSCTKKVFAERR